MTGPRFDDDLDYWVDNPDEYSNKAESFPFFTPRSLAAFVAAWPVMPVDNPDEFECPSCGMQSDDWGEYEAHNKDKHHRFVRRPVIAGVDVAA